MSFIDYKMTLMVMNYRTGRTAIKSSVCRLGCTREGNHRDRSPQGLKCGLKAIATVHYSIPVSQIRRGMRVGNQFIHIRL